MKKVMGIVCLLFMASGTARAQADGQKIDELIKAYANIKEFNGSVLVSRGGKILLQKGYGIKNIKQQTLNDAGTIYLTASITKTFTSAVILKLAELNKLSLSDKLDKYYPGYPKGDNITIENLLTHTSGIYEYVKDRTFMYNGATRPASQERMLSLFKNRDFDFEPGTSWKYSNSGYMLLGYIIEQVAKMRFDEAVRAYVFKPLKMNESGFDYAHLGISSKAVGYYSDSGKDYNKVAPVADSTVLYAAGSIYSTVGDLYKWHKGLQRYKMFSKGMATKAYSPNKFHNYGYGWIVDSLFGKRILSHSGGFWGFRSNLARITDDDICIVLLSNTETPGLNNITKKIVAILYKQPYTIPLPRQTIKLSEEVLKEYLGTYQITEPALKVEIKLEGGVLVSYPVQGPRTELSAIDATHFFLKEQEDFEVVFEKESSGQSYQMILNFNGKARVGKKIK